MSSSNQDRKMRVSFDLDEVLFVSPATHKTEPPLPFPLPLLRRYQLQHFPPRRSPPTRRLRQAPHRILLSSIDI